MELWQLDVTASLFLADGRECKVITGIDGHSRFCVMATVVLRATARAVCLAFVTAMRTYGVPGEVLSDNGKQFTGRFGQPRPAEVLFERICRENAITQRLTKPRSPTTTGKIERLHQTLQQELLNVHEPFASIEEAQAAVDAWRREYNADPPHQSLAMTFPAKRFTATTGSDFLGVRVPAELTARAPVAACDTPAAGPAAVMPPEARGRTGERAVELDRVVPPSGNLWLAGQQIWLGLAMTGRTVGLWAGLDRVHVLLDGHWIKALPSRPDHRDLARLAAAGARPAGQRVTLRLDGPVAHVRSGGLWVRTVTCLVPAQARARLRGARGGTAQSPRLAEPLTVKRRVSARGAIMIGGQRIQVGLPQAGKTARVTIDADTCQITVADGIAFAAPRTTSRDIKRHKASNYGPAR
jgi:hypothetical protein